METLARNGLKLGGESQRFTINIIIAITWFKFVSSFYQDRRT